MTGYDDRDTWGDWDPDLSAPGMWPRTRTIDPRGVWRPGDDGPPDRPRPDDHEPGLSPAALARTLTAVRAGRCTAKAADCGWYGDCVKHHPRTEQAAS